VKRIANIFGARIIKMKKKIFIDCDGTLINSLKILTTILNSRYNTNVQWEDVREYNLKDQFPQVSIQEILEIFDSNSFFLMAMNEIFPDCKRVVSRLCKDFDVNVLSIGTADNISKKSLFISSLFPEIQNCIFLVQSNIKMDKSIVKMGKQDTIIDDCVSNIISSSAGNRLLFSYKGIENNWNKNSDGIEIIPSWNEIERRIYGNNNDV
jgi:5'(3')-deoxyribonucleotidase